MLTTFYAAFAPTCFTLLGLWLIVVQTRHSEWRRSEAHRRRTYAVSLHFSLPGLMSLLSLVDPASTTLWRVAFAVVAAAGALGLLALARWGRTGRGGRVTAAAFAVAAAVYAVIAVVAMAPSLLHDLGTSLKPLRLEAILLSALVFLGVNVAWLLLFDDVDPDGAGATASASAAQA